MRRTPRRAVRLRRPARRGGRELAARLGIRGWQTPLIAREVRRGMARDPPRIRLFPGIADVQRHLSDAGVRLGMVSSNSEATVRAVLGPMAAGLFGHYECGVSVFGKARPLDPP